MNKLPEGNEVIAGRWTGDAGGASVEEGIAKTLHIELGDTLRFDVAGQSVEAPVTSLRKLDWGSMRVNFFVILPTDKMQGLPETYITAFHLPPGQDGARQPAHGQLPEHHRGQHGFDPAPDPGRARSGDRRCGVPAFISLRCWLA